MLQIGQLTYALLPPVCPHSNINFVENMLSHCKSFTSFLKCWATEARNLPKFYSHEMKELIRNDRKVSDNYKKESTIIENFDF